MLVSQYSNYPISSLNNLEVNLLGPSILSPWLWNNLVWGNEPLIFTQVRESGLYSRNLVDDTAVDSIVAQLLF